MRRSLFLLSGLVCLVSMADCGSSTENPADVDGQAPVCVQDEYGPWAGGADYYARWSHGPPSDPSFFPIAVWLQAASNAQAYADIGINTYIGLWEGPTEEQLTGLSEAGMPVICSQNDVGLAHLEDSIILGWMHQDEPDNAQWNGESYDPCIDPTVIRDLYDTWSQADPSRPIYLNLGQGAANEEWVGRGDCYGQDDDYPEYIAGADIVSFDIYPATSTRDNIAGNLWYVAHGVKRLTRWAGNAKPVWVWIETTHIDNPDRRPTPHEIKVEVWMAIIHGAMGIGYFAHEFSPSFIEAGLLAYDDVREGVAAINERVRSLAFVLNTPLVTNGVTVTSTNADVPVAAMLKRTQEATYLFAVSMRNGDTTAGFQLTCVPPSASVEVLDEGRSLTLSNGTMSDDFSGYDVHLYRIEH